MMDLEANTMIIHYTNGKSTEGLLLALSPNALRIAIPGENDVREFTGINGTWVSDDCEPARIEFAWERKKHQPEVTEADCICPPELAARLIHLLLSGEDEPSLRTAMPAASLQAAPWHQIV
jgi:hypothetical protein